MVLAAILMIAFLALVIYGIAFFAVSGTVILAVFSDVIVCGLFIWLVVRFFNKRRNK